MILKRGILVFSDPLKFLQALPKLSQEIIQIIQNQIDCPESLDLSWSHGLSSSTAFRTNKQNKVLTQLMAKIAK